MFFCTHQSLSNLIYIIYDCRIAVAWGSPLTTEGIAQVSQLIDYLMIDQSKYYEFIKNVTSVHLPSYFNKSNLRRHLTASFSVKSYTRFEIIIYISTIYNGILCESSTLFLAPFYSTLLQPFWLSSL